MQKTLWEVYADEGLVLWGIASEDEKGAVVQFVKQLGVQFPVLFDANGKVHEWYEQDYAFSNTVYPQDWLIGVDGTVVHFANQYDATTLIALVEAELAKMDPGRVEPRRDEH